MELSFPKTQSWLSWFLRGVLVLFFLFLISRLFELQIIKGKYYRELSDGNRVREIILPAPRGKILARGGENLIESSSSKKRIIFKSEGGFELSDNTSGVDSNELITVYKRNYFLGSEFAHAGGYLGEANEEEIGKIDPKCPEKGPRVLGDLVGRSGLEEEYDCSLRGTSGEALVEVDITGKYLRTLGKIEPIPGKDIKTNIDFGFQKKVAEEMKDKKGGIIATDAKGEVLAFYSSPSFDPNNVVKSLSDSSLPLFNRVIGGLYHPGSVFKPTMAAAALEEGKIDKNYRYLDTGIIRINDYSYTNWYFTQYGRTEGEIGLIRAMARSTDTFFYKLGEIVGIDGLVTYADKFGYSQKSGIDIPGEVIGLIPTPAWKKKVKNEAWFLGNTYHFAIGQGDVAVTPIEVNRAIEIIGNGGQICTPRIAGIPKCANLNLKKENLNLIKAGMEGVCSEGGTGYTFFDFSSKTEGKNVACKTGTAETNQDGKTHAWFTLFYPSDFPEINLTVLVEGGGEGSAIAGPIARKVMDYWVAK
jgi:penicillin-binding protein 2